MRLGPFSAQVAALDLPLQAIEAVQSLGATWRIRACSNVAVTRTLRADPSTPSNWNYTEVTVATPSKDSLCHAESGTTQFTWRQSFTASPLNCRYVEM
jgi:hypothetical protein